MGLSLLWSMRAGHQLILPTSYQAHMRMPRATGHRQAGEWDVARGVLQRLPQCMHGGISTLVYLHPCKVGVLCQSCTGTAAKIKSCPAPPRLFEQLQSTEPGPAEVDQDHAWPNRRPI